MGQGLISLPELFGVPEGTRYVYVLCPAHGDRGRPNLAVYQDGAYCFACGYRESPEQFLARVAQDPGALAVWARGGEGGGAERHTPEELEAWVREFEALLWEGPMAPRQAWLRERGLSLTWARRHRVGHTGVAFAIPYLDRQGRVMGIKLRADPGLGLDWRYRNLKGSGVQVYRPNPGGRPLVVVEGELDALLLAQYGADAVTLGAGAGSLKTLDSKVQLPERGVVVAVDWDPAGDEAARALLTKHPGWVRAERPEPGVKDLGEWVTKVPLEERGWRIRSFLYGIGS